MTFLTDLSLCKQLTTFIFACFDTFMQDKSVRKDSSHKFSRNIIQVATTIASIDEPILYSTSKLELTAYGQQLCRECLSSINHCKPFTFFKLMIPSLVCIFSSAWNQHCKFESKCLGSFLAVDAFDCTHSLANFQQSGLSDQQTLLLTETLYSTRNGATAMRKAWLCYAHWY